MTCPICFFREDYQKQLKKITFGISRFEDKLAKYKEIFIEGVRQMGSLSRCCCYSTYSHSELVSWTDSFLGALKNNEDEICAAFDSNILIYDDFIRRSQKVAAERLWSYLQKYNLLNEAESPIKYTRLLFRGRPKKHFDEKDIRQMFHVPFPMRHLVGNRRFSVSGQPMLYFGNSVLTVTKECESDVVGLAMAAFLPSYSRYFKAKIFSLTNHVGDCIENALPGLFLDGSKFTYDDLHYSFNRTTISRDIHQNVFLHICTFPTELKDAFVAEYTIPQMLTTALLENGFAGIIFPSTKDYSELTGYHRFSSHHLNIGIFVPYDKENDLNENLLSSFCGFTLNGREMFNLTVNDILQKCDEIRKANKKSPHNNSDYLIPVVHLRLHIEHMNQSRISGVNYFDTEVGKLELELYMKMLCRLEQFVNNPPIAG